MNYGNDEEDRNFDKFKKLIALAIVAVVVFIFLIANLNIIESGEVGIKKVGGKYDSEPMHAGIHWTAPWIGVEIVDAHLHAINYIVSPWDVNTLAIDHDVQDGVMTLSSIKATDSRGLIVDVDVSIRYQINETVIPLTISTYGRGWEEMLVNPIVRDVVRDVIAHYPAETIPMKRGEIGAAIELGMGTKIEKLANDPLFFAGSNLREVRLPAKINANITLVQESRQAKERAVQETELATQNALKVAAIAEGESKKLRISADANAYVRVAKAKASANAVRESSKAEAEAIAVRASAQAEANIKIANSLTPEFLQLEAIRSRTQLYANPSLKIVPEDSNMLFGSLFGNQ